MESVVRDGRVSWKQSIEAEGQQEGRKGRRPGGWRGLRRREEQVAVLFASMPSTLYTPTRGATCVGIQVTERKIPEFRDLTPEQVFLVADW